MRADNVLVAALLAAPLAGCSSGDGAPDPEPPVASASSSPLAPTDPSPTGSAPSTSDPSARPPFPVSLPAYFDRRFSGGDLRLGAMREQTADYTSYDASYRSGRLRVTGVLNVPRGRGPFPAVVLAHGYIDPAYYVSGQGMTRERGVLAVRGYVAFHVDYRNHAGSSVDPESDRELRLGYAVDVVNAVHALRETREVPVDDDRVAQMGRSMGGGVVYKALEMAPGLVGAAAV